MKCLPCNEAALAEATHCLLHGGVVVIPTDTVYGLAAHPDFPDAVARLYTIKGRAAQKPIALLAADVAAVEQFGATLAPAARALTSHWPGALTLVLPVGATEEGFRVPDHAWTRRLLAACGGVLRVTSANLSGKQPATAVPQALAEIGLSADLVIDDGISPGGIPSAVVRVVNDSVTVLRPHPSLRGRSPKQSIKQSIYEKDYH